MTSGDAVSNRNDNLARNIIHAIMWTALIVAPGFLGALATFFVARAFSDGFLSGLRSFAAVLLPLMVLTFVVAPKLGRDRDNTATDGTTGDNDHQAGDDAKALARSVDSLPLWLATLGMAAVGAVMMQLLNLSTSIPIVELVLSAGFSFILYLWADDKDRAAPYCLGLVIGALGYIIILGVPHV
ncbi:hypothetical protein [Actinocrispum sp. NPDC049592]|uniref:hypothetical protein n=1 Tax=Actinocrispum sp. NPDC049592 TaxID=3154835 RepID=UPI003416BD1A